MRLPISLAVLWSLAALSWPGAIAAAPDDGTRVVTFSDYTPLASNLVLAERLLSPLKAAAIPRRLAALGKGLREQPIDLSCETYRIYVPHAAPAGGYGLLVFVPPWDDNRLPSGWARVLEARGVVFVSPTHAGNEASPLGRREPLAILAAANLMKLYPVNPDRVWVAGFSGGSKVALRLALGYPDLFRGAFLDAGAEPIGTATLPLPSTELFERFRAASRLAFFSGGSDPAALAEIADSLASFRQWCVASAFTQTEAGLGHQIASSAALGWALSALEKPPTRGSPAGERCWAKVEGQVRSGLASARDAAAKGDVKRASALLERLDRHFAGLASPESVAIAEEIASVGGAAMGDRQGGARAH